MTNTLASGDRSGGNANTSGVVVDYQKIVNSAVAIFVASGGIVIVEPSPYELLFFIAMPIWFLGGATVRSRVLGLAALLFLFDLAGFVALVPHWERDDASVFQYLSAYLAFTAIFFALFVGDLTKTRVEVIFWAYTAGAAVAAICGILGYFGVAGFAELFTRYGRAMGTFKDPNVFGSFVGLPIVFLVQKLIFSRGPGMIPTAGLLLVLFTGVLLSFSRGAWGAALIATSLMAGSAFLTEKDPKMKRRIVNGAILAVGAVFLVLLALMSTEETRAFFVQRASVTQEYDEGETGRFGNQARSIPMLLDRFFGFGPLLFRNIFGIEPHSTYLGAFANGGWLGGLFFILIVGITCYIGFRMIFTRSPFQRQAQVAFPALFVTFLQAFQIDIDHWRHVFLLLGVVWGLEATRRDWEERGSREPGAS